MLIKADGRASINASICVVCQIVLTILFSICTQLSSFNFSKGYLDMASASMLFNPDLYIIFQLKCPNAEANLCPVASSLALVSL